MISRGFVKAKIEKKKGLYVSTITYSWFGIYHYDEVSVSETLEEAERILLKERTQGHLVYQLEGEEKTPESGKINK